MFFTDFRQGVKLALIKKTCGGWRDSVHLARRRIEGSSAVRLKRATYALQTLTEFHRSRKLVTATRASALALRFHGSDCPSEAIKASQRAWISSSICSCMPGTALTSLPFEKTARLLAGFSCSNRKPRRPRLFEQALQFRFLDWDVDAHKLGLSSEKPGCRSGEAGAHRPPRLSGRRTA